MSPSALRRQIGQLLIAGFRGEQIPVEIRSLAREFGLGGVILFGRNIVEPGQVAELCITRRQLTADVPAWVSVDQEGGRVATAESAVYGMAAHGDAWPERRRAPGGAICARAGGRAPGRRHHARFRAGSGRAHESEKPDYRRPCLSRACRGRGAVGERDRAHAAGRRRGGLREAFSRPWRYQHRLASRAAAGGAPTGTAARGRVRAVSRGHRSRRRDHHDGSRARPRAGRTVVPPRCPDGLSRASASGTEVQRRDSQRRPRDEGARQRLPGSGIGRPRD